VFAQQSWQPKLSRRRYPGVPCALQNNTVFRRAQNWVSDSDGSRTDNGSEFQSVAPETAKLLWPYLVVPERGTARSPEHLNGGDHDWLIQTPVSTVQRGMPVQPVADSCGVPSEMNWVLSWFNFNRLAHIHWPISPTHVTSFCILLSTAEGSAWKCSWVLSAYECTSSPCRPAIAMTSAQ